MGSRVKVEAYMPGIRETLKAPGIASLLGSQAKAAAARCNSMYGLSTTPRIEPYGGLASERRFSAVGVVFTRTKLGQIDNLLNNTLKKGCGI